jgi:DNA-binding FrmR family transcriptional regulator
MIMNENNVYYFTPRHEERDNEYKRMFYRVNRAESQVKRARQKCVNLVEQTSAATAAMNELSKELLAFHIRACLVPAIRAGNDEAIEDFIEKMQRLISR